MDWKKLDNDGLPRESIRFKRSSHVVVGRLIFWVGHKRFVSDDGHVVFKKHLLVSFDLIGHSFQVHDIDVVFRDGLTVPMCLSSLGNSLILSGSMAETDYYLFCGWSVLVDVTSLTSFTLPFAIITPNYVKLLGFTNDEISLPIVEAKVAGTLVRQVSYECGGCYHAASIGGTTRVGFKHSRILRSLHHSFQVHDIDVVFRDGLTVPMCLSSLGNSLILSGSTDETDYYLFCGWSVLVDVTSLTSFTLPFAIITPNYVKLLGFTNDEISLPIVEAKVAGTLVRQVSYECGGCYQYIFV
nr:hypothetical protein [Tanacetum cinerariifolium]